MSQECRCFLSTLQRYGKVSSKTNFLQIFVGTICDTAACLRQAAEIAPEAVVKQLENTEVTVSKVCITERKKQGNMAEYLELSGIILTFAPSKHC